MGIGGFFSENKRTLVFAAVFAALVLLVGIYLGKVEKYMPDPRPGELFGDARLKVGFLGDVPKLFVLSAKMPYKATEGKSFPTLPGEVVLGEAEARMMKEEGLFSKIGDELPGFFGIDAKIAGILEKTGTIADDAHFFSSEEDFLKLESGEYSAYSLGTEMGEIKFFLVAEPAPSRIPKIAKAKEGELASYSQSEDQYIPIILGSAEADMMRKEGLFSNVGDTIEGFFGKDVRIVAVLERTNSSLDMMHIVPFGKG